MRFEARTFWMAKDAIEPEQYQDAFELDAERGIAAIADGVTSAIFSGPWARVLTRAVLANPPMLDRPAEFEDWLARERATWRGQIDTSRLTWFQKPKMVDGAMSTLLWIEMIPKTFDDGAVTGDYQLRGYSIGDCCLFHLRGGECLSMFPMTDSDAFGLNPAVLGSVDRKADHLLQFALYEEVCQPDDLLVLCTDAIGLWAMHQYEASTAVDWESYWDMPDEMWKEHITALRAENAMRFDDSTLVLLRVLPVLAGNPLIDSKADTTAFILETDLAASPPETQQPPVEANYELSEAQVAQGAAHDELRIDQAIADPVDEPASLSSSNANQEMLDAPKQ